MKEWRLEFYRTSQAASYEDAKKDGAVRWYPVDEPQDFYDSMRVGHIGDLMDVIDVAVEMMDAGEEIEYVLLCDGEVFKRELVTPRRTR
jgi:hypothetical protein